jgi:hypothetical protein
MKSTTFIASNQVRAYLVGAYQKAHELNKAAPAWLSASNILSGWMQVEWSVPNEFCEADALQFLQEAAQFATKADYKKARDERVNELVFLDIKNRFASDVVTPEWVTERLIDHPGKRSEICSLLGFDAGDFSNFLSGKKPIPKSRAVLLWLFFNRG